MTLLFSDLLDLFYYMITNIFNNSLLRYFLYFIVLNWILWSLRRLLFS